MVHITCGFLFSRYIINNIPNIMRVFPKKPQARTAVRDITPIYATASISLKIEFRDLRTRNSSTRITAPVHIISVISYSPYDI